MTLVALTTQNRKSITGHAGMCRHFTLFEIDGPAVSARGVLELPREQSLHETGHDTPHPLDSVDVLVSGGMGAGLQQKLARRGIEALITSETDPVRAVELLALGQLPVLAAAAHEHAHAHEHGDHGGHAHPHHPEHGHHHAHGHGDGHDHDHAPGQRCAGCRCGH